MLKLTTDKHESSRGLSASAELLVIGTFITFMGAEDLLLGQRASYRSNAIFVYLKDDKQNNNMHDEMIKYNNRLKINEREHTAERLCL